MATIPTVEYIVGADLDDLGLFVRANRQLIDLSSGHSFTLIVGDGSSGTGGFTKTTSMTGAAGSGTPPSGTPNLVVTWETTGELNNLTGATTYPAQLTILRTTDQRQRKRLFRIRMVQGLG